MPPAVLVLTTATAAVVNSVASFCFLIGRFTGAGFLKKFAAHRILGALRNHQCARLPVDRLQARLAFGGCVFLSYFFMSIMFPTIFALGIFGLGVRAKQASAYIVMAILGGAIAPKIMGYLADRTSLSIGFIVPALCFAFVGLYGLLLAQT